MTPEFFDRHFVGPVLSQMAAYDPRFDSQQARMLLIGTACMESNFCQYNRQIKGPALGIMQVEPATEQWIRREYMLRHKPLYLVMHKLAGTIEADDEYYSGLLESSWHYSIFISRLKYFSIPHPMPDGLDALAKYWDDHYNANPSEGFPDEFVAKYKKYAGDFMPRSPLPA